ncbi:MAG TPA: hypothetical protein VFU31_19325 [Candidatus Binatia bacterium]|nr:hypothetical protein [Candidatus Binatia bacterium]
MRPIRDLLREEDALKVKGKNMIRTLIQRLERFDDWLRKRNQFGVPNVVPVLIWLAVLAVIAVTIHITCN